MIFYWSMFLLGFRNDVILFNLRNLLNKEKVKVIYLVILGELLLFEVLKIVFENIGKVGNKS